MDTYYFPFQGNNRKWVCCSDYSFDKNKPNDVITFSLIPVIGNLQILNDTINKIAPSEIKKAKTVSPLFLSLMKDSPIINFSFILENHKYHLWNDNKELSENINIGLDRLTKSIQSWESVKGPLNEWHKGVIDKINEVGRTIKGKRKIRIIKNLFLITALGSCICTQIANRINMEALCWISDRDEIHDVSNYFAVDLFNIELIQHLVNPDIQFSAAKASSRDNEWYDGLIKIPDYITGVLADYSITTGSISHSKFEPIIKQLLIDNRRNTFVFKLDFKNNGQITLSRMGFRNT